jgi:S-adenosylmethionine decarboxylase
MDQNPPVEAVDLRFFEGAEKKVEIVVDGEQPSLRAAGDTYWAGIASLAGATVLSKIDNAHCDAFLLSESSLFVFDHKMVMITCGQTCLPDAVFGLLERVPADAVDFFIYERKNEVYPHRQPTSFYDDVRRLGEVLPGRAFRFGDEDEHHILLFHLDRPYRGPSDDLTLEVLMYGIDESVRVQFEGGGQSEASHVRERLDLGELARGFRLDDHAFEPSGYSLNGIREDKYWTLHVTPEANGSYVSFETNLEQGSDLGRVTDKLVELFRPRAVDTLLFRRGEDLPLRPEGYGLRSYVAGALACGYEVGFRSFHRPGSGVRRPAEIQLG